MKAYSFILQLKPIIHIEMQLGSFHGIGCHFCECDSLSNYSECDILANINHVFQEI